MTDAPPEFATEREATLYALANHYRQIIDRILHQAHQRRVLYSDHVIRDLNWLITTAPAAEAIYPQPCAIETAPRDGRTLVLLTRSSPDPVIGRWQSARPRGWVDMRDNEITPYAYVPIGPAAPTARRKA